MDDTTLCQKKIQTSFIKILLENQIEKIWKRVRTILNFFCGTRLFNFSNPPAVDKAVAFLDRDELPPHWDRDILFNMGDDSTTESSESEELDEEDDSESPEEKDRLVSFYLISLALFKRDTTIYKHAFSKVAELYKHMEDRGQPINKNPTIDGREVDLHRLFKLVYKAGGQVRVTNKNMWQQVRNDTFLPN